MATHKFAVGDRVRLIVSKYAGDVPAGIYTISRKRRSRRISANTRVKHAQDGHERVVREDQVIGPGADQA